LSRAAATSWHSNSIGKHAWLAGQATKVRTQKLRGEEELTGVLPEEQGRRPGRRHDGAASVVAARPPSRSCTGEEAASCSRPSGQALHGGNVGVAAAFQPTRRQGEHRKHRRARIGAPAKLARVDQAAWARSIRAELDGDGGDWRRGVTKPHGQEEEHDEAK
jgi:hypothetical protein